MEKILAKLIILAAAKREASYDKEAYEKAYERAPTCKETSMKICDPAKFYTLSLHESCKIVCENEEQDGLTYPVYLLLTNSWNDALDWARDISK